MLVLEDSPYGDRVPIQIGTLHIDRVIDLISQDEIDDLTRKWKRGRISTFLANRAEILNAGHVTMESSTQFTLDKVLGTVKTTRAVEIPLFQTVLIQALSKVEGHEKRVNVSTNAPPKPFSKSVVAIPDYTYSHQQSSRVSVGLRN